MVRAEQSGEVELRDRIEGSRRSLPLARVPDADPPETYTDLAKDYPVALPWKHGLPASALQTSEIPFADVKRAA